MPEKMLKTVSYIPFKVDIFDAHRHENGDYYCVARDVPFAAVDDRWEAYMEEVSNER